MIDEKRLEGCYEELLELEKTLCRIPAPSWKEQKRAAFVKEWLSRWGETRVDEADNVLFTSFDDGSDGAVLICAHTDTVFPDMEPFEPEERDGKLFCPGAGDDTQNLAAMMLLIKYLVESGAKPRCPVLFAANTGEEGLGNLRGSRQLVKDYGKRLRAFVSFDGDYEDICNGAVGSHRYRVTVRTPGGHSYGDFGSRNAIAELSRIISRIYEIRVPDAGRTTYNVGTVRGGTSVNTIAQEASMLCEYRSENVRCLAVMEQLFRRIFGDTVRDESVTVDVEVVGMRPCSSEDVDAGEERSLTERAAAAVRSVFPDAACVCHASSTDCNIPLSAGIPSVAFGLYAGSGAHTREESIELDSLVPGMKIGAAFLSNYFD